jgi:hypothetical protein
MNSDWTSRKLWVTIAVVALAAAVVFSMAYVAVENPDKFDAYKAGVIALATVVAGVVARNYQTVQGAIDEAHVTAQPATPAPPAISVLKGIAELLPQVIATIEAAQPRAVSVEPGKLVLGVSQPAAAPGAPAVPAAAEPAAPAAPPQ